MDNPSDCAFDDDCSVSAIQQPWLGKLVTGKQKEKKKPWTEAEDQIILSYAKRWEVRRRWTNGDLDKIVNQLEGRTLEAVQRRWYNTLKPSFISRIDGGGGGEKPVNKERKRWTEEEDQIILSHAKKESAFRRRCTKASFIKVIDQLEGRTLAAIQQRWNRLKRSFVASIDGGDGEGKSVDEDSMNEDATEDSSGPGSSPMKKRGNSAAAATKKQKKSRQGKRKNCEYTMETDKDRDEWVILDHSCLDSDLRKNDRIIFRDESDKNMPVYATYVGDFKFNDSAGNAISYLVRIKGRKTPRWIPQKAIKSILLPKDYDLTGERDREGGGDKVKNEGEGTSPPKGAEHSTAEHCVPIIALNDDNDGSGNGDDHGKYDNGDNGPTNDRESEAFTCSASNEHQGRPSANDTDANERHLLHSRGAGRNCHVTEDQKAAQAAPTTEPPETTTRTYQRTVPSPSPLSFSKADSNKRQRTSIVVTPHSKNTSGQKGHTLGCTENGTPGNKHIENPENNESSSLSCTAVKVVKEEGGKPCTPTTFVYDLTNEQDPIVTPQYGHIDSRQRVHHSKPFVTSSSDSGAKRGRLMSPSSSTSSDSIEVIVIDVDEDTPSCGGGSSMCDDENISGDGHENGSIGISSGGKEAAASDSLQALAHSHRHAHNTSCDLLRHSNVTGCQEEASQGGQCRDEGVHLDHLLDSVAGSRTNGKRTVGERLRSYQEQYEQAKRMYLNACRENDERDKVFYRCVMDGLVKMLTSGDY